MKQLLQTLYLAIAAMLFSTTVNAQTPWKCSGKAIGTYNPISNSYTDDTKLYSANFSANGNVSYINKTATTGIGLNGIGYRKQDNFVYGVRYTTGSGVANELCQIDSNGVIVSLGAISGLKADVQYYAGAFDNKGYLYVSSGSGSTPYYLYKIDVNTRTATNMGSIGTYRLIDMAFDPLTDSLFATSSNVNSNGGELINIDISNNPLIISSKGTTDVFMFGLFFTGGSQLYGFGRNKDNSTSYYKIDKSNGVIISAGAGPSATNADACSCPFRISHTLSAVANCINPGQDTSLTVNISNLSSSTQNTSFDLTLDYRLSFNQTAEQIQSAIQILFPGSSVIVTLSNADGGTNNKISINTIAVPAATSLIPSIPFHLGIKIKKASFMSGEKISFQSTVDVPGNTLNSGSSLSDNPLTAQLDDATTLTICLPEPGPAPVPVTITDFKGQVNQKNVNLTWNTKQEINTQKFEIERSSDGTNFTGISEVISRGNGSTTTSYSFADMNVSAGAAVYYRLKVIDLDGNFKYTSIVVLKLNAVKGQVTIYPSPFTDKIAVNTFIEDRSDLKITICDATGRKMVDKSTIAEKGNNTIILNDLSRLQKGFYFINIYNGGKLVESKKIIKVQ